MAHQGLDGPKIVAVVEKGSGKRVPHHMGMNPFLDLRLLYHGLDEAVNIFLC